jgi:hypothetical protein
MKMLRTILLFSITGLFSSCAGLHVFNSTNAPCLRTKHDGNVNAYVGADHAELQATYAPVNHLGLFLNGYGASSIASLGAQSSFNSSGTNLLEGAGGYFTEIGKLSSGFHLFCDVYAGLGTGQRKYNGESSFNTYDEYAVSSSYQKAFLQGSVYLIKGRSQLALSVQGSLFYFNYLDEQLSYQWHLGAVPGALLSREKFSVYNTNIALTYKLRVFNRFSLIAQLAGNLNNMSSNYPILDQYGIPHSGLNFNGRPVELNVGFQYCFGY